MREGEGGQAVENAAHTYSICEQCLKTVDNSHTSTLHPPPPLPSFPVSSGPFATPRVVAVKTIRVLEGFDDATSYLASGAKVLHLVRDPRAVVRSQLLHFSTESFMEAIPNFQELRGIKDGRKRQTETRRALGQM